MRPVSTSRQPVLLVTMSQSELPRLKQLVTAPVHLRTVGNRTELSRALESCDDWSGLIASDAFCISAFAVATAFRTHAPFSPAMLLLKDVGPDALATACALHAFAVPSESGIESVNRFIEWSVGLSHRGETDVIGAFTAVGAKARLTPRELAVFSATMLGATKHEISTVAGVAVTTVKSQRQAATGKVGASRMRALRQTLLEQLLRRKDTAE